MGDEELGDSFRVLRIRLIHDCVEKALAVGVAAMVQE